MPYYATSQEWLRQSSLLIEARPSTTRITTKYHISRPKARRIRPPHASTTSTSAPASTTATASATEAGPRAAPRGSLTLKTYDPRSGACLKYRTTKAAEVSRLILSLGHPLGAHMAALPRPEGEDLVMADAPAEEGAKGGAVDKERKEEREGGVEAVVVPPVATGSKAQQQQQQQQQGGAGGGSSGGGGGAKGKKKRGKK
ncbi:signal recognition particle 9 kDa protein-domain-containing protein [Hypoxylon sp. NC1633]|nr:signal recognition particle 9 kDa protein-domain-containing protein [Hypoxylon sp. NC1633]